jgi:simple sugar transport system ATP-binding protein
MAGEHTLTPTTEAKSALLRVRGLSKHFDHVVALSDVSFEAHSHQVLGLVGDNGAGKSTLIKLISGVHRANAGEIYLADQQIAFETPRESRDAGIEVIYQDMALVNELEVWENVFLGRLLRNNFGIIQRKRMIEEAAHLLERLGLHALSPTTQVGYLSGGQKKGVAISRALYWDTRLIFMDEPTAALAVFEIRKVLEQIETLRQGGVAVVFVSHNLKEVLATADRVMVLHRGQLTGIRNAKETSEDEIIRLMMGTA